MKTILFIVIGLVITAMIVLANTIRKLIKQVKFTEELVDLEKNFIRERPVNYQNYIYIRGKFDELRSWRVKNERFDEAWELFKDKYLEYFVRDSFRRVG